MPQRLILTEYDLDINDYVFKPKQMERGSKYDSDYLLEKWTVVIHESGKETTHSDAQIVPKYAQKQMLLIYDNKNKQKALMEKTFRIVRNDGNVVIKFLSNKNTIQIECGNDRAAKYWFRKFKGLAV